MSLSIPADVFFAHDVLHAGDVGYGALATVWGAGMVAGAVGLARRVRREWMVTGALVAIFVQGLGKPIAAICHGPWVLCSTKMLKGRRVGTFDVELGREFFGGFVSAALCNLHLEVRYGENAHHMIEALFKAFARATSAASRRDPRVVGVPSTKGTLTS